MARKSLSISEASLTYELSEDTLRYYEKVGLAKSHRKESGIRYYDEDDQARLEFIKCMRNAGVSVEALIRYMKLIEQGDSTIPERKALLAEQREELIKKRAAIETSIERLNYKIANYDQIFKKKGQ
jgi:MerR family transcriptional regulator, aldehyde-responsive regulator